MTIPCGQDDLERLRRGDRKEVAQWFERYCDTVTAYVLGRVGFDTDIAADVVQETFVLALTRIHRFNPQRGDMAAWLITGSRNVIKKALRFKQRHRPLTVLETCQNTDNIYSGLRIDHAALPDRIVEARETRQLVQAALSDLPPRFYTILRDYYYGRQTIKALAETRNLSEAAAKALLYRARLAFKTTFTRRCTLASD